MKISAINSTSYMTKNVSFKNTAVPYPEYEYAYYIQQPSSINKMIDKISALFTPEVTQKSKEIKHNIDKICESNQNYGSYNNSKKQLFSVVA